METPCFGISKAFSANVLPSNTVFFDQDTPTTPGVVFDPNTPEQLDTLYVSTTNSSTWIWNGSAYVTYTAPTTSSTEFYIAGTTIDAGSNKTSPIERSGEIRVKNSSFAGLRTISGTKEIRVLSTSATFNKIQSSGGDFYIATQDAYNIYFSTTNVERMRILSSGAIRFNQAYTFPTTDGTAGQFLKTDGAGVLTFGSAGLQYFTEAQNTSAPNATVPVDSLSAVTATPNGDVAFVPKGNGAFILAIPDNLITGGNKRGQYSIDLQLSRSNSNMVTSGNYSGILGGLDNRVTGDYSFSAGSTNVVTGSFCFAFGGFNTVGSGNSSCYAYGVSNNSTGTRTHAYGTENIVTGTDCASIRYANTSSSDYSISTGGRTVADGAYSFTSGFRSNVFGLTGRRSHSSGMFSTSGDSQKSTMVLRVATTDATETELTANGVSAGSTNHLILQNNSAMRFKGTLIGKESGSTNTCAYDIDGSIVRGANAASTTLTIGNVTLVNTTALWGIPTLTADTTFGGLSIKVTGKTSTNIQWTCFIDTAEVIYA